MAEEDDRLGRSGSTDDQSGSWATTTENLRARQDSGGIAHVTGSRRTPEGHVIECLPDLDGIRVSNVEDVLVPHLELLGHEEGRGIPEIHSVNGWYDLLTGGELTEIYIQSFEGLAPLAAVQEYLRWICALIQKAARFGNSLAERQPFLTKLEDAIQSGYIASTDCRPARSIS